MGALVLFAMVGVLGILGLSSGDDGADIIIDPPPPPDEPMTLQGTEGQDDMLIGGQANDTITGNLNEADILDGQGGDDLLFVQDGNTATGGAGSDTFDVTTGAKATITDFVEGEDTLQILILNDPDTTPDEQRAQLYWVMTPAGAELHDITDATTARTEATRIVTLAGLTAPPADFLVSWEG